MIRVPYLVLLLLPFLAGCFEEPTGPAEIRYDRDVCEICRMIISDPRFAAQVRGGEHMDVWKFDDIGDALHWLKEQPWRDDPKTEIWVTDYDHPGEWLDARKAHYVSGVVSPMDYGFGAVGDSRDGAVDFAAMQAAVIERGLTSRCDTPDGHVQAPEDHPLMQKKEHDH